MFFKSLPIKDCLENIPGLFKNPCSKALFLEELNCTNYFPTMQSSYLYVLGREGSNWLNLDQPEACNSYCHMNQPYHIALLWKQQEYVNRTQERNIEQEEEICNVLTLD